MIEYDKYDLLELFECEPTKPYEEDVGIYNYKRTDIYDFTLELYLSLYDQRCCLTIWYKNFGNPIFDLTFENINKIKSKKEQLIIEQANNPKKYSYLFQANLYS